MKLHPDQLGEPDADGHISIGVKNWFGPDPAIPGYVPWRIYLNHVGDPPRVVIYERRTSRGREDPAQPVSQLHLRAPA